MTKWLYNNKKYLRSGKAWSDDFGIQHPGNWNTWTLEEKTARGIVEIIETTPPDGKLYHYGQNKDGTYTSTPKELDDKIIVGTNGEPDHVQKGLRSNFIREVKQQQQSLLSQTDWAIVRKQDISKAVPVEIAQYRNAVRVASTAMRLAITNAPTFEDFEALFLKYTSNEDGTQTKTGVLFDWPEAPVDI